MSPQLYANRLSNFNPRTPCGVRLVCLAIRCYLLNFNPRTPCGVRLCFDRLSRWLKDFNPRTPCGVRRGGASILSRRPSISIHAPLAGCDSNQLTLQYRYKEISIHAPLAGCDVLPLSSAAAKPTDFNPRTPCGVRHIIFLKYSLESGISIHAPLAGCDAHGQLFEY